MRSTMLSMVIEKSAVWWWNFHAPFAGASSWIRAYCGRTLGSKASCEQCPENCQNFSAWAFMQQILVTRTSPACSLWRRYLLLSRGLLHMLLILVLWWNPSARVLTVSRHSSPIWPSKSSWFARQLLPLAPSADTKQTCNTLYWFVWSQYHVNLFSISPWNRA